MAAAAFVYAFDTSTRAAGFVRVSVPYADADPVPVPVSSLVPAELLRVRLLRVLNDFIVPRQRSYVREYQQRADALEPDERRLMGRVGADRIVFDEYVASDKVQDVLTEGFENGDEVQAANTVRELAVIEGLDVVTQTPSTAQAVLDTVRVSTEKIQYVGNAYYEQINSILYTGFIEGQTKETIAKLLQGRNAVLNSRAEFIARNEMGNMYAKLTEIRQTENGVTHYIWRTSEDERVRPTHVANNGVEFSWDEPPPETGHPGADYNCRCYSEPVLPEFEEEQLESGGGPALGVEAVEEIPTQRFSGALPKGMKVPSQLLTDDHRSAIFADVVDVLQDLDAQGALGPDVGVEIIGSFIGDGRPNDIDVLLTVKGGWRPIHEAIENEMFNRGGGYKSPDTIDLLVANLERKSQAKWVEELRASTRDKYGAPLILKQPI